MNIGELFVQIGAIGNSKEVKAFGAAVKKAGKAIDDYDKKLKKSEGSGTKLTASIKGTIGAIVGVAGALAGAYYALDRLTDSLAKQNLQWLNLTRQSDIALSTFQKWGTIGKIVGVDNAAQQLENLNQKIFNLRLTGEGAKGFQMAGIMPTTADDVLEQLRTRISGMKNTAATYLLQQMGLDPKMITLLRMGREEWEEYLRVQRQYTLNDIQRKEIDRLNRQLEVAKIKMGFLKDRLVLALMPAFVRFTRFIISAVEGISRLVNIFIKSDNPLIKFERNLNKIRLAIAAIGVALWAITAHPIIAAITAIIGAIMLLADDVNHYLSGGGSVIGVILKGLQDIDLKGFIDFPVPKWLEYLIRVIDYFDKHKFMIPLQAVPGLNVIPYVDAAVKTFGNVGERNMSPAAKQQIWNNQSYHTMNDKNTQISMQNTFYTNQPAQDIVNSLYYLPYLQTQSIGNL